MMATETDPQVIEAIVYALPEIVRAVTATRNSLSPRLRTPQVRALLRLTMAEGLTMGELAREIGISYAGATQVKEMPISRASSPIVSPSAIEIGRAHV